MLVPVILAGGVGARLWPISREQHPKPFLRMADGLSLLQKTFLRATQLGGVERVLTVANRDVYLRAKNEYALAYTADAIAAEFLLEPCPRNTAPAIAMAALRIAAQTGPDTVMLVMPSDHLIADERAFVNAVNAAVRAAKDGYLVTFGVRPTRAETGYGYIEVAGRLDGARTGNSDVVVSLTEPVYRVRSFVEKPARERAAEFVRAGSYLWNAGIFCFSAGAYLAALARHAPQIERAATQAFEKSQTDTDGRVTTIDARAFAVVPDDSIDYAILQLADNVAAVGCDPGWNDIGSWAAISDLAEKDTDGNHLQGEVVAVATRDCYVQSEERMVATVGVRDLVIVDTPDALLIANRAHTQQVKEVVKFLKKANHPSCVAHRTVHRPWGTYTVLEESERFKIKRIVVNPGAALSLQMHFHRNEHWVVVSGTAKIVNGDEERLIRTNESTYIPAGVAHRLMNPGTLELVMIEVQSGDYLGEDDIVRFDDRYGRVPQA